MQGWKLRRELRRLARQLHGALTSPLEAVVRARRSRAVLFGSERSTILGGTKVAIFVLYQPGGVPESVFATVGYLASAGYGVIAVSNAPLGDVDRERLKAVTVDVVERPNFGYDFGAYQEVILSLQDRIEHIEALLLMNDSVWFPFLQDGVSIRAVEELPLDVVAAQIFGERLLATGRSPRSYPILGSYFLLFRKPALAHPVFLDFWRAYRMSSNKDKTVRRGERELSRRLQDAGLACGGLLSDRQFEETLRSLSGERLRQAVEELVCLSSAAERSRSDLLCATGDVGEQMRALLLDVSATKNVLGSSPLVCLEVMRAGFIKKNNDMLYRLARQRIADALEQGRLADANPIMARELLERAALDRGKPELAAAVPA
ncbi:rhamnan synthesis protein F [Silicimonas algicola]|uniref:Rhamnan synthesis protein F n=1 Tax=Silicimonas algicola TaxID=1826607 RepID=A0A316G7C5_9RHOB|nr:rhamnan synthesis protein F [Silicimonas algicola]